MQIDWEKINPALERYFIDYPKYRTFYTHFNQRTHRTLIFNFTDWKTEEALKFLIGVENYLSRAVLDSRIQFNYDQKVGYIDFVGAFEKVTSLMGDLEMPIGISYTIYEKPNEELDAKFSRDF